MKTNILCSILFLACSAGTMLAQSEDFILGDERDGQTYKTVRIGYKQSESVSFII